VDGRFAVCHSRSDYLQADHLTADLIQAYYLSPYLSADGR
jgi:hypothetical protein